MVRKISMLLLLVGMLCTGCATPRIAGIRSQTVIKAEKVQVQPGTYYSSFQLGNTLEMPAL